MASAGGANDAGTIFRFDPSTGSVTAVHHFTAAAPRTPVSRLVEAADGSLYGTTLDGGAGSVFRLRRLAGGGHAFSTVRTLDPATAGTTPQADLVLVSSGFIYGAAAGGGPSSGGTVFRFDSLERGGIGDPTQFAVIHAFSSIGPGWRPLTPPVLGPDGALYGLTSAGGANGRGDVYRFNPTTGGRTVVGAVPTWPFSLAADLPVNTAPVPGGDGSLYAAIGSQNGTEGRILRVIPSTSTVEIAATVALPQGSLGFLSGLSAGPAGIFGLRVTTAEGLVLFRFTPATGTLTTVASLTRDDVWRARLAAAGDGLVYVNMTTYNAGRNPAAVSQVLRVDPATAAVTLLASQSTGSSTSSALGPDGSVFFGDGSLLRAVSPSTLAIRTVCTVSHIGLTALAIRPDFSSVFVVAGPSPNPELYSCPIGGGPATLIHAFGNADGEVSELAFADGLFYGVTNGGFLFQPDVTPRGGMLFRIAGTGATPPFDPDGDGLTSIFESTFGLSQASASGDDGASGDPDGDGLTNLQEQVAGSHPRGVQTRYLAEGVSNAFFSTQIALGNAALTPATVLLRFFTDGTNSVPLVVTVPPTSRGTVDVGQVVGSYSTTIESDVPITVDRTITWGVGGQRYGSHGELAASRAVDDVVLRRRVDVGCVRAVLPAAEPGRDGRHRDRALSPAVRSPADREDVHAAGVEPHDDSRRRRGAPTLASTDVSAAIAATAPIIAERAMYRSSATQLFAAGHASAGVTAPALEWFLAEGATGAFFDLFILIANPNTDAGGDHRRVPASRWRHLDQELRRAGERPA